MADVKISQLTEQTAPAAATTFVPVVTSDPGNRKVSIQNVVKAGIAAGGVGLSSVATSGSYTDLSNTPASPAISTLTDVDATGVADGTILRYSTSKWRPYPDTNVTDGGNW
jgi:hypothetical protein